MTELVFVPVDRAAAGALRQGRDPGPRPAYAPTARLAAGLGPLPEPEEVDFAALSQAGVLALTTTTDPLRLVLAAEVDDAQVGSDEDDGLVTVAGLRWDQVRSLFADEPAAAAAVARARTAPGAVDALLAAYDLLWFAPEELDHVQGFCR